MVSDRALGPPPGLRPGRRRRRPLSRHGVSGASPGEWRDGAPAPPSSSSASLPGRGRARPQHPNPADGVGRRHARLKKATPRTPPAPACADPHDPRGRRCPFGGSRRARRRSATAAGEPRRPPAWDTYVRVVIGSEILQLVGEERHRRPGLRRLLHGTPVDGRRSVSATRPKTVTCAASSVFMSMYIAPIRRRRD
ncbi:hypothetical protein ACRAWF_33270 [Streptomyces sp. L7]